MKQITKAGLLAVGVALVSQAAQAQFTPNDLYLGFTEKPGSSADYIIDLGGASTISSLFSGTTPLNLDSYFSTSIFTSLFTSASGVGVGVVGGINQFPSSHDVYFTAPVGMDMSGVTFNATTIGTIVNPIARLTVGADTSQSWAANIPVNDPSDFYGASGINPDLTIDSSYFDSVANDYVVEESLWEATPGSTTFVGNIIMDVPEPSAVTLLGGCGALLGILRWRKVSKNA